MPSIPTRRLPVAGVDPIVDARTAWSVFEHARRLPPCAEVIVIGLDPARRGVGIVQVSGTHRADDVVDVVEAVVTAADPPDGAALVVASMRPGLPLAAADVARWRRLDAICGRAGLVLVEWFVDGGRRHGRLVGLPRERAGDASRWLPRPRARAR
jgi:hypothetical protein